MSHLERLRPPGEIRSEAEILKEADEDLFSKFERTDFICSLQLFRESVLETTKQSGQPATFLMTDLSARPFAYAIKELFSDQSQKPRIGFLPIDRLLPREIKISNRDFFYRYFIFRFFLEVMIKSNKSSLNISRLIIAGISKP